MLKGHNGAQLKGDYLNLASCWGLLAVCKVRKTFEMVVQKSGYPWAGLSQCLFCGVCNLHNPWAIYSA